MENHPIPQDVTGFKFKLIGSVTVKQFLYIMAGGIMCAVFFMVPMNIFIKIPLCILFGGTGAALAFIPIEGRPMDVMLKNFLKALPAENQYIFKKKGAEVLIAELFSPVTVVTQKAAVQKTVDQDAKDTRRALLFKTLRQSYRPDDKEQAVLSNINTYLNESAQAVTLPVQNIDSIPVNTATQVVALPSMPTTPTPQLIAQAPQMNSTQDVKISTPKTPAMEIPMAKPSPPIQDVEKIHEDEPEPAPVVAVQPQPVEVIPVPEVPTPHVNIAPEEPIATQAVPLTTVTPQAPATPQQSAAPSSVASLPPDASLNAGFPSLPDTPNIVMGIIKDPRGRVMPNILVEIMDTQGIPVRAFKTNSLGQFMAATPLPNGEYNVLLEDPKKQNEFGPIQMSLSGEIFQPLEIVSVDQREKLRKELFGGTSAQAQ